MEGTKMIPSSVYHWNAILFGPDTDVKISFRGMNDQTWILSRGEIETQRTLSISKFIRIFVADTIRLSPS